MLQENTDLDVPLLENDASCPKFYSLLKTDWEQIVALISLKPYLEQDDRVYFAGMFQKKIEGVFVHIGNEKNAKIMNESIKKELKNVGFEFECEDFKNNLKKCFNELVKHQIPDLQFFIRKDGNITVFDPSTTNKEKCEVNVNNGFNKMTKKYSDERIASLWHAIYAEELIFSRRKL